MPAAGSETSVRDRIIVALDVQTADEAREISRELSGHVGAFKIGLQLFTSAGPGLVREFADAGIKVFLDLKFHDIPNTVAKASVEAARLRLWMFNIHAAGGREMMRRTVAEVDNVCAADKIERPLIICVTVLTSSNDETLTEIGVADSAAGQVIRLAKLVEECGLDGVVASPQEVTAIKAAVTRKDFLAVTPGIRSTFATGDDQKRVTNLRQALVAGSDYVVIGRPITQAKNRVEAVNQIVAECLAAT